MSIEIELKARVDFPPAVKKRLSRLGKYCYDYEKSDTYWIFPAHSAVHVKTPNTVPEKLRVRRESMTGGQTRILVTRKTREIRGGIEINDEQEFTVSDGDAFEKILVRLGLTPEAKKEKRGSAWQCGGEDGLPPILAELSDVTRLGCFIELEIISGCRDEQILEQNRQRLLALLEKLDIPPRRIEPRPYTELLRENEH